MAGIWLVLRRRTFRKPKSYLRGWHLALPNAERHRFGLPTVRPTLLVSFALEEVLKTSGQLGEHITAIWSRQREMPAIPHRSVPFQDSRDKLATMRRSPIRGVLEPASVREGVVAHNGSVPGCLPARQWTPPFLLEAEPQTIRFTLEESARNRGHEWTSADPGTPAIDLIEGRVEQKLLFGDGDKMSAPATRLGGRSARSVTIAPEQATGLMGLPPLVGRWRNGGLNAQRTSGNLESPEHVDQDRGRQNAAVRAAELAPQFAVREGH
jgi:hypothetical protein